jgi:hypothetical protein
LEVISQTGAEKAPKQGIDFQRFLTEEYRRLTRAMPLISGEPWEAEDRDARRRHRHSRTATSPATKIEIDGRASRSGSRERGWVGAKKRRLGQSG